MSLHRVLFRFIKNKALIAFAIFLSTPHDQIYRSTRTWEAQLMVKRGFSYDILYTRAFLRPARKNRPPEEAICRTSLPCTLPILCAYTRKPHTILRAESIASNSTYRASYGVRYLLSLLEQPPGPFSHRFAFCSLSEMVQALLVCFQRHVPGYSSEMDNSSAIEFL